jgi:hypothetical protein
LPSTSGAAATTSGASAPPPAGALRGESTPFSLHHAAQPRIVEAVPSARMIALLRDPMPRVAEDVRLLERVTGVDFGDWVTSIDDPFGDRGAAERTRRRRA